MEVLVKTKFNVGDLVHLLGISSDGNKLLLSFYVKKINCILTETPIRIEYSGSSTENGSDVCCQDVEESKLLALKEEALSNFQTQLNQEVTTKVEGFKQKYINTNNGNNK